MNPLSSPHHTASLRRLVALHPCASLLIIVSLFVLTPFLTQWVPPPFLLHALVRESLLAVLVAVLLTLGGWWEASGFTRRVQRQTPIICLGAFLLMGWPLLTSLPTWPAVPISVTVMTLVLALLVGFVEEGLWRGIVGCLFLPKGIGCYVLLSALLFAMMHALPLFWARFGVLPPPSVMGQVVVTFGMGTLLAAIRLRTGSIWPTILLHALYDGPSLLWLASLPTRPDSEPVPLLLLGACVYGLLFGLCAAFLLRKSQREHLRLAHGLPLQRVGGSPWWARVTSAGSSFLMIWRIRA